MVEIVWQDPPSRGGKGYEQIIEALKQNPGKWALVNPKWKTSAAPAAFRQHGCEATTRKNDDGKTWSFYARSPMPKAQPRPAAPSPADDKAAVHRAVQTGTALIPPPPVIPRPKVGEEPPAEDPGLSKYLEARRARVS
jgi:hypothetical protein